MKNTGNTVKIKAVFFDLGKVIIPYDNNMLEEGYGKYCKMKPGKFLDYMDSSEEVDRYMSGRITSSQFYMMTSKVFNMKIKYNEFYDVWNGMFWRSPEVESIIRGIRQKYSRIKLILVSNINDEHYNFIKERYDILDEFDELVLSHEVGRTKPHPDIFNEAIKLSGCLPKDTFYTDDIARFIDAARTLGIRAYQFTGHEDLRNNLSRFGVVV